MLPSQGVPARVLMDVTLPAVMTVDEVDAYLRIPRLGLQARTAGEDSLPEGGEALEVPEGGGG